MHSLEEIFHPKSIAVTGASQNPSSRGYSYTDHLINYGFKGQIYPVNPKYSVILGHKAYPSVADIPGAGGLFSKKGKGDSFLYRPFQRNRESTGSRA